MSVHASHPETVKCRSCGHNFTVPEADLEFLSRIAPVFGDTRIPVPAPSHCPRCRLQRRLAWRNEYSYFSRNCDLCGKSMVSVHAPSANYPVYCYQCWWSDRWNPLDFGREYRAGVSFFQQFAELAEEVPQVAMMNDNGVQSENCEYCQDFAFGKDCYLVTASWEDRECMYSSQVNGCSEVLDSFLLLKCELTYESLLGTGHYHSGWLTASSGCSECFFGYDLRECRNCIGCCGLRQAQYCLFNRQLTQDQYLKELANLRIDTRDGLAGLSRRFAEFLRRSPRKATHQIGCENCNGDSLQHCKELQGFGVINGEHSRYIWQGDGVRSSLDLNVTGRAEWCYEGATVDHSYMTLFSLWSWKSKHLLYCDNCHSSEHLFGCIGVRHGSHTILNRQYSPESYAKLARDIACEMQGSGEWGEFFPMSLSPFYYNDTRAADLRPFDAAQAAERGLKFRETLRRDARPPERQIPAALGDADDALAGALLSCHGCARNFKILAKELQIYRKLGVAIPDHCPDCRRRARFAAYPPTGELIERSCSACGVSLKTPFDAAAAPLLYCESCYQSRVHT